MIGHADMVVAVQAQGGVGQAEAVRRVGPADQRAVMPTAPAVVGGAVERVGHHPVGVSGPGQQATNFRIGQGPVVNGHVIDIPGEIAGGPLGIGTDGEVYPGGGRQALRHRRHALGAVEMQEHAVDGIIVDKGQMIPAVEGHEQGFPRNRVGRHRHRCRHRADRCPPPESRNNTRCDGK